MIIVFLYYFVRYIINSSGLRLYYKNNKTIQFFIKSPSHVMSIISFVFFREEKTKNIRHTQRDIKGKKNIQNHRSSWV